MPKSTCGYELIEDGKSTYWCQREVWEPDAQKCIFHSEKTEEKAKEFKKKIFAHLNAKPKKITLGVGKSNEAMIDCIGYVFPANSLSGNLTLSYPIVFHRAQFVGNISFSGWTFENNVVFSEAQFSRDAMFSKAQFSGVAWFDRVRFSGDTYFDDAQFRGDARFLKTQLNGVARFDGAQFRGDANFDDAQFSGETRFRMAQFSGTARFTEAQFCEDAWFDETQFRGDANFSNAKFSRAARFDAAQFSREAYFRQVQFSGAVLFTAQFSGNAWFRWVQFNGQAWFKKSQFSGKASFREAQFRGDANFDDAQFSEYAQFEKAQFGDEVSFHDVQFGGKAIFLHTQFGGKAWFRKAKFSDWATFGGAQFNGLVIFDKTQYRGDADFSYALFKEESILLDNASVVGQLNLEGVRLSGNLYLSNAQLGTINANNMRYGGSISLERTRFTDTDPKKPSSFENVVIERANFIKTNLEYVSFRNAFLREANFDQVTFHNLKRASGLQQWWLEAIFLGRPREMIYQEACLARVSKKKDDFETAATIYRAIKNTSEKQRYYGLAARMRAGELECSYQISSGFEKFFLWMYRFLNGFGIRWFRALVIWIFTVLLFAVLFYTGQSTDKGSLDIWGAFLHSVETASVIKSPSQEIVFKVGIRAIEFFQKLVSPILLALFGQALRNSTRA